jgi:hypothetical protein
MTTLGIMALGIATFVAMTLGIMTLQNGILTKTLQNNQQHNDILHKNTECDVTMTLIITVISIMSLSIMTPGITTVSIMTPHKKALSIKTLSITSLSIMVFSLTTLSITRLRKTQSIFAILQQSV